MVNGDCIFEIHTKKIMYRSDIATSGSQTLFTIIPFLLTPLLFRYIHPLLAKKSGNMRDRDRC